MGSKEKKKLAARIAKRMWKEDGEPPYEGPGSGGLSVYASWTRQTLDTLEAMGLMVVKAPKDVRRG